MRITGAELFEVRMPLREPFVSSAGQRSERRILLVRARGDEGSEGWGECVAGETPSYSPETTETAWHVLTRFILPDLVGMEVLDPVEILASSRWIRGHHMARAAAEMACWDLQARELGVPLRELLGGGEGGLPVAIVLGVDADLVALGDRAQEALEAGYAMVKLKVQPGQDIEPVQALRERFPTLALGVDANGAYTLEDLPRLRELDAYGLVMLEQPLAPAAWLDHARLQSALQTPICLDESITGEDELRLALELEACRMVSLKPGLVGGLREARRMHDLCLDSGIPVRCGGMLESGIGRAHNLALASLPGFVVAGDLSESRRYWVQDLVTPEFELVRGRMLPAQGPGIGVEPDVGRIRELALRRMGFGDLA